jgi:hypothetical protein
MNTRSLSERLLGIAFLLQFITSFASGLFLQPALITPGNISQTMVTIANNAGLMMGSILVDMLTAMGIVFLGVMLYWVLRKQNEIMALLGLGLYILEANLLVGSRLAAFWLLPLSEEYATVGQAAYLQTLGSLALESMDFVGLSLHLLVFCVGAILFYILLYQSRVIPRAISLWGLVTVLPILFGTVVAMFGYEVSAIFYVPYVPFEFVAGIWILVRGLNPRPQERLALEPA